MSADPIIQVDLYSGGRYLCVCIAETGEVIGRVREIVVSENDDGAERRIVFAEHAKNFPEAHDRWVAVLKKAGFKIEYRP